MLLADGDPGPLPGVTVTRYLTPLREGGSLPGLVEGDDLGTYVCKFRGAGQGPRVLAAEIIVGELARRIGLDTPRQVVLDLSPEIARYEAHEEVQDLLTASVGANLGSDFLPGSFGFDAHQGSPPEVVSTIVWLDAFCANVDRSWRNPNLPWWGDALWVIDHGASLYFHHAWPGGSLTREGAAQRFADQPWDPSDHGVDPASVDLAGVDAALRADLGGGVLAEVLDLVPDAWLEPVPGADTPAEVRAAYVDFLSARLASRAWLPGGTGA